MIQISNHLRDSEKAMEDSEVKVWDIEGHNLSTPAPLKICSHHNKTEWTTGTYTLNTDGSVSCVDCPWGTYVPGYMRWVKGKIVDLRTVKRDNPVQAS